MENTQVVDTTKDRKKICSEINQCIFQSEIHALKYMIPLNKKGIQIGTGNGLYAKLLGISEGVESIAYLRDVARRTGMTVYKGIPEELPVASESYDFVLINTTLCFIQDLYKTINEIKRILKKNGTFIFAFIDKKSCTYLKDIKKKNRDSYYKNAQLFSSKEVLSKLKECGLKNREVTQTVFGTHNEIHIIQDFKKGYGKGCFIIVKSLNK